MARKKKPPVELPDVEQYLPATVFEQFDRDLTSGMLVQLFLARAEGHSATFTIEEINTANETYGHMAVEYVGTEISFTARLIEPIPGHREGVTYVVLGGDPTVG